MDLTPARLVSLPFVLPFNFDAVSDLWYLDLDMLTIFIDHNLELNCCWYSHRLPFLFYILAALYLEKLLAKVEKPIIFSYVSHFLHHLHAFVLLYFLSQKKLY